MATVTGALLGIATLVPLIALLVPSRQRHPEDGMAIGFLMMFIVFMMIPLRLLTFGVIRQHPRIVKVLFWVRVVVAVYVGLAFTADIVTKAIRSS